MTLGKKTHRWRRRDYCFFVGLRAAKLNPSLAAVAWNTLARRLEALGDKDVPKFIDLLAAVRAATISAKKKGPNQ